MSSWILFWPSDGQSSRTFFRGHRARILADRSDVAEERMDDNYVCDIPDVISVADKSTQLSLAQKTCTDVSWTSLRR